MKFGIEIEYSYGPPFEDLVDLLWLKGMRARVQGHYSHTAGTDGYWVIKPDGSVAGGEVVSPILDEDDMQSVITVIEVMEAYCESDEHCGIHIHVDASEMTFQNIRNLALETYNIEDILFDYCGVRRKRNTYCSPMDKSMAERISKAKTLDEIIDCYDSKYYGLNLLSIREHGTIEFRYFGAHFSPLLVIGYVFLTLGAVKRAISKDYNVHICPPEKQAPKTGDRIRRRFLYSWCDLKKAFPEELREPFLTIARFQIEQTKRIEAGLETRLIT